MGGSPIFYLCCAIRSCGFVCTAQRHDDGFAMMDLPARLEPVLAELGYELVMLERAGRGLLRIFIDKPDGITIEDCAKVRNHLSHLFTVENIDYDRLEVSSIVMP